MQVIQNSILNILPVRGVTLCVVTSVTFPDDGCVLLIDMVEFVIRSAISKKHIRSKKN